MAHHCLIIVYGTSDLLSGICAVQHYAHKYQVEIDVTVMLQGVVLGPDRVQQVVSSIEQIINGYNWPAPIVVSQADVSSIAQIFFWQSPQIAFQRFRQYLNIDHVDAIFYSHNVIGQVVNLTMMAYPRAMRITYGEAMGSVLDKRYFDAELKTSKKAVRPWRPVHLGEWLRQIRMAGHKLLYRHLRFDAEATIAMLILPMDYRGDYLDDKYLQIVPRETVVDVIGVCYAGLDNLAQYIQDLLSEVQGVPYLFLLGNLADGKYSSAENEIAMYLEIAHQYIPKGVDVFVKGHPLSTLPIDRLVCEHLKRDYRPHRVADEFSRYPIELWLDLISACEIVSQSYSCISLSYLYDKQAHYTFNASLIERYIYPEYWSFYKKTDKIYREMLAALETWDCQSLLWKGPADLSPGKLLQEE